MAPVVSAVGRAFGAPSFSWRVAEEPQSPSSSLVISETGMRSGGQTWDSRAGLSGSCGAAWRHYFVLALRITIETAKRRWLALVRPIYGPRSLPHPPAQI